MKQFIKTYWKTLFFFAIVGLIGGFFTGIYVLDSYPADIKQQLLEELNDSGLGQASADMLMGVITAVQSVGYGIVLGAIGIWLGKKTGLWKDERAITKKASDRFTCRCRRRRSCNDFTRYAVLRTTFKGDHGFLCSKADRSISVGNRNVWCGHRRSDAETFLYVSDCSRSVEGVS